MSKLPEFDYTDDRTGLITSSRFQAILTGKKTYQAYLDQLIAERSADDLYIERNSTPAEMWGKRNEPRARAMIEWLYNVDIIIPKTIRSTQYPFMAASPDGLLFDGEQWCTAEIKCPKTLAPHLKVHWEGDVPNKHCAQVQGQMLVTGLRRSWFFSYHPAFNAFDERPLVRVVVDYDELYCLDLLSGILNFQRRIEDTIGGLSTGKTHADFLGEKLPT